MNHQLKAPFPWFGGKSRAASLVWGRLGTVTSYVEPFAGSLAVLLGRTPFFDGGWGAETVNDKDGFIVNAWRAIQRKPDETAEWADNPVFECDLHARHVWMARRREWLARRLEGDPEYCDPQIAGWWLWGVSLWIGGQFCNAPGPWVVRDGKLVKRHGRKDGVWRQRPNVTWGSGVIGVQRKRPDLHRDSGTTRRMPALKENGRGVAGVDSLADYFVRLSNRLRHVRVCCGDWRRVLGDSVTIHKAAVTGILLDPPYSHSERDKDLYAEDARWVATEVREWCLEHGDDPRLRIALCGLEGEHTIIEEHGWTVETWQANGGYGNRNGGDMNGNKHRERIWFSPACIQPEREPSLFEGIPT